MAEIGTDISKATSILANGGLVAIPTETVYGLAANAFNEDAVLKIFKVKNRPAFDPLITHIGSREQLIDLTGHIPPKAVELMNAFWPGPLTLVLKKTNNISDLISSGLTTAAFRMPNILLPGRCCKNWISQLLLQVQIHLDMLVQQVLPM